MPYTLNSVDTILGVPLNEIVWLIHAYQMSKDNPALTQEFERVKILYHLSKDRNGNTET